MDGARTLSLFFFWVVVVCVYGGEAVCVVLCAVGLNEPLVNRFLFVFFLLSANTSDGKWPNIEQGRDSDSQLSTAISVLVCEESLTIFTTNFHKLTY